MSTHSLLTYDMIKTLRSSLGIKLFLILTAIIILAAAPLYYIAREAFNQYGQDAAFLSEQQIRQQSHAYLKEITREKANKFQNFFDRISTSAALLGTQASTLFSDIPFYAAKPLEHYQYRLSSSNGMFANSITDPVATLFWGSNEITPQILEKLDALTHMTPFYRRILTDNPEALASHIITVSGIGQYCTNSSPSKLAAFNLPPASVFDIRDGQPMTIFTSSPNKEKKVRWTDIYKDDVIEGFMLTASAPIYDDSGNFRGVTGIDVPLATITDEVINFSNTQRTDGILFSFLLDQNGKILALPDKYYFLFGLAVDRSDFAHSDESLNLPLSLSSHEVIRNLSKTMTKENDTFTQLTLNAENYIVTSSRLAKQNWIFGIVIGENDLLTSVKENRDDLKISVRDLKKKVALSSIFTIISAVGVLFLLLKYLITPLRDLAAATKRVADGDLTVRSKVSTQDEIGILATSFNAMVSQLEDVRQDQNYYANRLKSEVELQNMELSNKKAELEKAITLLKTEIERRQIIGEALRNSQRRYYDTLESTKAGVYIIEEGVFTYVNTAFAQAIFNIPKYKLIGMNPLDLVDPEDRQLTSDNIARRYRGEDFPPYTIKCVRGDGTRFYGEVWSKISLWQDNKVMVGTITDVTNIKENEELLQLQDQQLQKSLEEKEILLKEIYHRTKNNMLMIISMLDLQSHEIEDERVTSIFRETEARIRTMALVHEKLYQSQDLSEIDMGSYLIELAESLLDSMTHSKEIAFHHEIETIPVSIDSAVPLGLVVNEIITNSIKHAFPDDKGGKISLKVKISTDQEYVVIVADNGIGLPEDIDVFNATSFGMGIIVTSLVKLQLRGKLSIDRSNGTKYIISFPKPQVTKRI